MTNPEQPIELNVDVDTEETIEQELPEEPFVLDYVSTFDNSHLWQIQQEIAKEIAPLINLRRRQFELLEG
jgi:DNA-dependent RNA polymerase auxiliary subunit epsilon